MKVKLTLTIEEKVIDAAKQYAHSNGKSLSDIVENYLKSISSSEKKNENLSPKIVKLMGVINLPKDFNYKEELGMILSKKVLNRS